MLLNSPLSKSRCGLCRALSQAATAVCRETMPIAQKQKWLHAQNP